MVKHPIKLLVVCYLAAAVCWLGLWAVHTGRNALHLADGTMTEAVLSPQQVSSDAFENCTQTGRMGAPDDDPDWYISTDSDPHIFWQGSAYVESVSLRAVYARPSDGIVLYYLLPGQTDYSETQKVYAVKYADGDYRFALGGKTVTALRIDPAGTGGVTALWRGITLNPAGGTKVPLLPDACTALLLLAIPAACAAVFTILLSLAHGANGANTKP